MVTIVDYRVFENSEKKSFCCLVIQGDLELVKSKGTGKFYATARRTVITCTFDEAMCKTLIGKQLKGAIIKEPAEAYEYVVPESGEVITLEHKYTYVPEAGGVEDAVFA